MTDVWRTLDADESPFLHYALDRSAAYDDDEMFIFGLDLLLDGIRRKAGN